MKKSMWIAAVATLLVLIVLPTTFVSAQAGGTLTQADLDKFIADFPEFVKWADDKGDVWDRDEAMSGGTEVGEEIQNYLQDKGWDVQKFFYVFTTVVHETLLSTHGGGDMAAMLQAQRESIANNPDMPADQKEQALAELDKAILQAGSGAGMGMEIHPDDTKLIQANKDKLLEALAAAE